MRLFVSAIVMAALCVACVPPADEVCRLGVEVVCDKNHECTPAEVKESEDWQAMFGTDPDDCLELLAAARNCDDFEDHDELCEADPTGSNFNIRKASDCSDAQREQSCEDYMAWQEGDDSKYPEVCLERCTDD